MKRITIIGGGASGTLLAINLLDGAGDDRLEINLVEKRENVFKTCLRRARSTATL